LDFELRPGTFRGMGISYRVGRVFLLVVAACGGASPSSCPLNSTGRELELDRGELTVYPVVMQQSAGDARRLDFKDLLDAQAVFKAIQASHQADVGHTAVAKVIAQLVAQGLVPQSLTNQTTQSSNQTDTATVSDAGASATSSTQNQGQAQATAVSSVLPPSTPPPFALSASAPPTGATAAYHELLYATADAILGGKSLQDLYNVKAEPDAELYTIPVVSSLVPGRITRKNYTAEATIDFCSEGATRAHFRVLAVAPAGFTRAVNESASALRQAAIGGSLSIPILSGMLSTGGSLQRTQETLDALSHMVSRADLQVSIVKDCEVRLRYLGIEGFKGNITLLPTSFNTEILVMAKASALADVSDKPPVNTTARGRDCTPAEEDAGTCFDWNDFTECTAFEKDAGTCLSAHIKLTPEITLVDWPTVLTHIPRVQYAKSLHYKIATQFKPYFRLSEQSPDAGAYDVFVESDLHVQVATPTVQAAVDKALIDPGGTDIAITGSGFREVESQQAGDPEKRSRRICVNAFKDDVLLKTQGAPSVDNNLVMVRLVTKVAKPAEKKEKGSALRVVVEIKQSEKGADPCSGSPPDVRTIAHSVLNVGWDDGGEKRIAVDPQIELGEVTGSIHAGFIALYAKVNANTDVMSFLVDGQPAFVGRVQLEKGEGKRNAEAWFRVDAGVPEKITSKRLKVSVVDGTGRVRGSKDVTVTW